jgi:hypothetical protein
MTKEQRKLIRVTIDERRMVAGRTGIAYVTIPESTPSDIIQGVVKQMIEDGTITWTDTPDDDFIITRETDVHEVASVPLGVDVAHCSFVMDECHRHSEETGKEAAHG